MSQVIGRAFICHSAWMAVYGLLLCLGASDFVAFAGSFAVELVIAQKLLIPELNKWIDEGEPPSNRSAGG